MNPTTLLNLSPALLREVLNPATPMAPRGERNERTLALVLAVASFLAAAVIVFA